MKANATFRFFVFWSSQSISQLGSAMTSFALIIWAYEQTGSAMTVSLLTFFYYLPYIAASAFAGAFVDRYRKKAIMLLADLGAALCSLAVLALSLGGGLQIIHIYLINGLSGLLNAFQSPASTVAVGILAPEARYERVSGLNSFSSSLIQVVTPMLAASVLSYFGLNGVLAIDLASFSAAFFVLLLWIPIPEARAKAHQKRGREDWKEGIRFIGKDRGLLFLILSMALLNLLSRLTYENILPPMILSRSGGNDRVLGLVSGCLGVGGILGGLLVSVLPAPRDKRKMIYLPAAFSFLFGDLLLGVGQSAGVWVAAALAASIPIPFLSAGQSALLYRRVPRELQGRVFAARNALQYFTIPLGTLLGGALADYAFEPMMRGSTSLAALLRRLVGEEKGSGMAVMFLCTGIIGFCSSILWYRSRPIRLLQRELEEQPGKGTAL